MSELDRFLSECSIEKKARIVLRLAEGEYDIPKAREVMDLWEHKGFDSLTVSVRRDILKVIGRL